MERRRFGREFKLEAVKLVRGAWSDGGAGRKWVKDFAADPQHAFPGWGRRRALK